MVSIHKVSVVGRARVSPRLGSLLLKSQRQRGDLWEGDPVGKEGAARLRLPHGRPRGGCQQRKGRQERPWAQGTQALPRAHLPRQHSQHQARPEGLPPPCVPSIPQFPFIMEADRMQMSF